jgi:hypothetical protein
MEGLTGKSGNFGVGDGRNRRTEGDQPVTVRVGRGGAPEHQGRKVEEGAAIKKGIYLCL